MYLGGSSRHITMKLKNERRSMHVGRALTIYDGCCTKHTLRVFITQPPLAPSRTYHPCFHDKDAGTENTPLKVVHPTSIHPAINTVFILTGYHKKFSSARSSATDIPGTKTPRSSRSQVSSSRLSLILEIISRALRPYAIEIWAPNAMHLSSARP